MRVVPPGLSRTTVRPEVLGEGGVLALGVDDGDPAARRAGAVDGGLAPQQALDERRLAVAGLAEHPAVRVGDQPGGVGLERVPAELGAAGEQVEADVGAPVPERGLHGERVDARRRARWCPGGRRAAAPGGS